MRLGFTGHRDRLTAEDALEALKVAHPDAVWVHGGARGFDTQVQEFAERNQIPTEVHHPDYAKHGRAAPMVRNVLIVTAADVMAACWDRRETGGTFHAVTLARKKGKPIILLPVIHPSASPQ